MCESKELDGQAIKIFYQPYCNIMFDPHFLHQIQLQENIIPEFASYLLDKTINFRSFILRLLFTQCYLIDKRIASKSFLVFHVNIAFLGVHPVQFLQGIPIYNNAIPSHAADDKWNSPAP